MWPLARGTQTHKSTHPLSHTHLQEQQQGGAHIPKLRAQLLRLCAVAQQRGLEGEHDACGGCERLRGVEEGGTPGMCARILCLCAVAQNRGQEEVKRSTSGGEHQGVLTAQLQTHVQ